MSALKISQKIALGFGCILLLLLGVGIFSYVEVHFIDSELKSVINKNKLISKLTLEQANHLRWSNNVSETLSDDRITEVNVESDPGRCAFGKWYYSQRRKDAEKLVPGIASLMDKMESFHTNLHHSVIGISKHFKQADPLLPGIIQAKIVDHLKWVNAIRSVFTHHSDKLDVQTDPTKCALGKWFKSTHAKKAYAHGDQDFKKVWDELLQYHEKLHHSAIEIKQYLAFEKLAQAQNDQKKIAKEWDSISKQFFNILDEIMEQVIDPAKDEAAKKGNISLLVKMSDVDMVMNEKIIQPFLEIKLLLKKDHVSLSEYTSEYLKLQKNLTEWRHLVKDNQKLEIAAGKIFASFEKMDTAARAFIDASQQELAASKSVEKAKSIFENKVLGLLEENLSHLEELKEEANHELVGMRKANEIFANQSTPNLKEIEILFNQAREIVNEDVINGNKSIMNNTLRIKSIVLTVTIISLIVGCILAFLIAMSIVRPVTQANKMLQDIAQGEGNLAQRMEVNTKDEIGEMAKWFNVFIGKIQQIIIQVNSMTDALVGSSDQLASVSKQLTERTDESNERTNAVATATEEMNTNIRVVASASEQATTNIGMVAAATEEMSTSIGEIASNSSQAQEVTSTAVTKTQNASSRINELGDAAKEIGTVTETITDISEQTNLLALNATIEAARAGEAGKGFAVVASEIKELAKQTAKSTDEIKMKIETIQSITQVSVDEIEHVTKVIQDVNDYITSIAAAIEQQTVVTKEIAGNVAHASQGVQEVSQSVSEAAQVTSEITQNISDVSTCSLDCSNGSQKVDDSASDLKELAEKLKSIVGQFKV
ncbi:methyl-accepting chemotaxis protein [Candidatus Magnetomorum sp. HK-1]|nr:methyl-accepting chemotaxis protein [Candidatus Magnetomorum sp. HK-1]